MHLLTHLLFPHHTNNFKAKILHSPSILLITAVFIAIYIMRVPTHVSQILGYTADRLPTEKIVEITNKKRVENGLSPLKFDPLLVSAAVAKGGDMLSNNYWAHVSPNGITPWSFFLNSGYEYRYAGENLARDFESPEDIVSAWLASPTHRENLLSSKYEDVGIAVVEGKLGGRPTTLIVQLFGTRDKGIMASGTVPAAQLPPVSTSSLTLASSSNISSSNLTSPFALQRGIILGLIGLLLFAIAIDGLVVWERKIIRVGGRSLAHFGFLLSIGIIVWLVERGAVL